jgi:hypothetical protein
MLLHQYLSGAQRAIKVRSSAGVIGYQDVDQLYRAARRVIGDDGLRISCQQNPHCDNVNTILPAQSGRIR